MNISRRVNWRAEARMFSAYLVGVVPEDDLLKRYADAVETLFGPTIGSDELAVMRFISLHPWSLGPLDAACGVLRPSSQLRARLLVMTAILETTPRFADRFLPVTLTAWRLLLELGLQAARGAVKFLIGVPILALVRSRQ